MKYLIADEPQRKVIILNNADFSVLRSNVENFAFANYVNERNHKDFGLIKEVVDEKENL